MARFWPWGNKKPAEPSEATQARERAEKDLKRARERSEQVRSVTESLRTIQQENHFVDRIEHLIRGGV